MIFQSSIKIKLIQAITLSMVIILFALSLLILINQKQNIVNSYKSTVVATTKTAAISIVESFLYSDEKNPISDDFLQSYIQQFMARNNNYKFAVILDNENVVRAHSKIEEYGHFFDDVYSNSALTSDNMKTHIYTKDNELILEVAMPLKISSKSWGALRVGFDGDLIKKDLIQLFGYIYILSVIAIVVIIFGVWIITSKITNNLFETVRHLDKITLSENEVISLPKSNDEIGMLNEKFQNIHQKLIDSISQLKETNQNLLHTEKLASLGRLASGVAHEINNPLLGMKNCIYLIKRDIDDKENIHSNLLLLNESLHKIESIVNQLLGISRTSEESKIQFNINQIILNVVDLLEYRFKSKNIKVELDLDAGLPKYFGFAQLLEEAILNISLNAIDALDVSDPVYKIRTFILDDNIVLNFIDNGHGISDEVKPTIFEPFYTTKEVGKGTGLGLYVCEETITNMNGTISIINQKNNQTNFEIKLPLLKFKEGKTN